MSPVHSVARRPRLPACLYIYRWCRKTIPPNQTFAILEFCAELCHRVMKHFIISDIYIYDGKIMSQGERHDWQHSRVRGGGLLLGREDRIPWLKRQGVVPEGGLLGRQVCLFPLHLLQHAPRRADVQQPPHGPEGTKTPSSSPRSRLMSVRCLDPHPT